MSDDESDVSDLILRICVVCGLICLGLMMGCASSNSFNHKEAVERGFAYYEVDSSGNTTFKWRDSPATCAEMR